MSYVVFARKWRPQKFGDLIGQDAIVKTLQNAITLNRVSHALLFTGPRGVGKTTMARLLAKALNCEKGPTAEPCGECSNCREIMNGNNVDVLEIDGASNTSVDDVRELIENVRYRPSKSVHKIYIIDEVHMLSTSAFNALLKTLEEPPPGVMFIFATTEPQKIPETILSRCQRFDFKEVSVLQISEHLKRIAEAEKLDIDSGSFSLVAKQAAGSVRDSLSLLDQVVAFCGEKISEDALVSVLGLTDRALISQTLESFASYETVKALEILDEVFKKGFDPKTYVSEVWERVRDLLVLHCGGSSQLVEATAEDRERLAEMASQAELSELERWFDLLKQSCQEIGRVEFPRYLLEATFIRITKKPAGASIYKMMEEIKANSSGERHRVSSKPARTVAKKEEPTAAKSEAITERVRQDVEHSPEWKRLVEVVKQEKPSFAAVLLQSTGGILGENRIHLTFEAGSFYASRAEEKDFQEFILKKAKDLFGRILQIKIDSGAKSSNSTKSTARSESKSRDREALKHPVIQQAVSLFDAKVEEIKTIK